MNWSRTWKKHTCKISEKDIWVKNMWSFLSKWVKEVKIFVLHVNVNQNTTSAECEFNNQVYQITYCVDSKSLCLVISIIGQ